MHTTGSLKSTGCSSSQQSKLMSDSVQSSMIHTPNRGKKRERPEHNVNQSKRDQSSRIDDKITLTNRKHENVTKSDALEFITNKDGGMDLSHVDHLILLMRQDNFDAGGRSYDLSSQRIKLVSIIAETDDEEFWRQYIQLGGLSILDEWLQGHKGNTKEADKNEEELILVILSVLDKLPINLEALRACTIGKSVNHLRNHKNQEIQKEARKLVDVWKKRVEHEMNLKDETNGEIDEDPSHVPKNSLVDKAPKSNTYTVDGMETKFSASVKNSLHLVSCVHSIDTSPKEDPSILELKGNQDPSPLKEDPAAFSCLDLEERNEERKNCTLNASESSDTATRDCFLAEKCLPEVKENRKCRLDKDEIAESVATSRYLMEKFSSEICMVHEIDDSGSINDDNLLWPDKNLSDLSFKLESNANELSNRGNPVGNVPGIIKAETGIVEVDHTRSKIGGTINMLRSNCAESSASANQGDTSTYVAGDNGVANIVCSKQGVNGKALKVLTDEVKDIPTFLGEGGSDVGVPETSQVPPKSGILSHAVSDSNDLTQEKSTDNKRISSDSEPCVGSALVMTGQALDCIESVTEKPDCNVPVTPKTDSSGLERMQFISPLTEARESQQLQPSACLDTFMEQDKLDVVRTEDDQASDREVIDSVENCGFATNTSTEVCPIVAEISKPENGDAFSESCSKRDGYILFDQSTKDKCHDFDLNEGLLMDDFTKDYDTFASSPLAVSKLAASSSVTAPVAVVAASKGGYFPAVSFLQNSGKIGWKGSAATSAFRPAEPRHASGRTLVTVDIPSQNTEKLSKPIRNLFKFDLNIASEGLEGEGISSETDTSLSHTQKSGRLSLDLNHVDEGREFATTDIHCAAKVALGRKQIHNSRPDIRDLDLNDCPLEEAGSETIPPYSISGNVGIFNPCVGGLGFSSSYPRLQGPSFPGLNMTRIDPPFSEGSAEPVLSFRPASLPSSAAAVYPAMPTFFGTGFPFVSNVPVTSLPFPSGSSPYSVTSGTIGTVPISLASSEKSGLREVMPVFVPPVLMNARELGESGNVYTWGKQDIDPAYNHKLKGHGKHGLWNE